MSGTRGEAQDQRAALSEIARDAAGRIRRFVLGVTSRALWQIIGHTLLDGTVETENAEVFTGIGFYARPPSSGGNPEAIVVYPGGAGNPVIVAARDEKTRQAVAQLEADETAVFTSKAMIAIKADGTVEIRTVDGTAAALATKNDLAVLRQAATTAVIAVGAGGAAAIFTAADALLAAAVPPTGPTWPDGTKTLKAE